MVLTHGNLLAERDAAFKVIHVSEQDAVLGVLPLFHSLAQLANLLLPFAVGARVVFLETITSTDLVRALSEREITIFACVPQFFYLIHQRVMAQVTSAGWFARLLFRALLAANFRLRRIGVNIGPTVFGRVHAIMGRRMRLFVTGGSKFDPAIGRDLYALGFTILQAYGLTETSGAATMSTPDEAHVDTVGRALPGVEARILPDEEIAIRGADRDAGLLQSSRRDRPGDAGWLVPHRRPWPHGQPGTDHDHRAQEGDDRAGLGEEHLPGGDRGALPQVAAREGNLRARHCGRRIGSAASGCTR